jgi:hypothetical protein
MTKDAALPSIFPPANGGVLVIGSVADSATRHAVRDAVVWFYSTGTGPLDTTVAYTDSAGGFAVRLPRRDRYTYRAGSVNFSMRRGSIDVVRATETLRVVLHHDGWLCDVRLTAR